MPEHITLHRHTDPRFAAVAEIAFDRAVKRNALTPAMLDDLAAMLDDLAADDSCRAILLRGEGPVFCSGFDLSLCGADSSALAGMLRGLSAATRAIRAAPKPVVIAAHGAAIAGGCALLAAADIIIADRHAKLGYPVVKLGISPAVNAPLLAGAIGPAAARRRLLDPDLISGEEAHRIGLVSRLVDIPEDVLPRAQIEAAALAQKPPQALAATKRWLNEIEGLTDASLDKALHASLALVGSSEERERLAKFLSR